MISKCGFYLILACILNVLNRIFLQRKSSLRYVIYAKKSQDDISLWNESSSYKIFVFFYPFYDYQFLKMMA